MTMMEDLSRPAPDPHPQSTEEGPQSPVDEDILPNDYRPDDVDDHIFRTPEDMKITVIGDTEDSEVQFLNIAPPAPEKRRERKRPRWFDKYTAMRKRNKKSKTAVNVDPLRVVDGKLLMTFHKWLLGTIGNKYPRECFSGTHDAA
ncbi:uncharacterized protein LOC133816758 [Humulus lupulus]|uniref:uncharacterized protein LOC133816758 n=1 Tax=Humulus lupulus TaxID=3486 RepID=UPI002B404D38|nr:uncharacterized protein LOC133816758 [Humulus lupulus]